MPDFTRNIQGIATLPFQDPFNSLAETRPLTPHKSVQVEWQVETPAIVVGGPEPRTVLQIRALRDCKTITFYVGFPDQPKDLDAWMEVLFQEPVSGKQPLRVRRIGGPARVVAFADFAGEFARQGVRPLRDHPDNPGRPHPYAEGLDERTVAMLSGELAIAENRCAYPHDFWQGVMQTAPLELLKGQAIGIVVSSAKRVRCKAMIGGI